MFEGEHTARMTREEAIEAVCSYMAGILIAKNADYGNSSQASPYLCPEVSAQAGIEIRISDKLARWRQLSKTFRSAQNQPRVAESLEDTVLDTMGYCVLWLLAERHVVPGGHVDKAITAFLQRKKNVGQESGQNQDV